MIDNNKTIRLQLFPIQHTFAWCLDIMNATTSIVSNPAADIKRLGFDRASITMKIITPTSIKEYTMLKKYKIQTYYIVT